MNSYNYEIITDTGSNLTEEQAKRYGVRVMGFPYVIDGKSHTDDPRGKTFETKDVYNLLRNKIDIKTSLINSTAMEEFFEPFLKEGKDVLYICLSGGISGTYQNALACAKALNEKYPERKTSVVDSLSGSYSQGILVPKTAKQRESGASITEAAEYASKMRYKITHDFTIDDLFFMKRSGRLSGAIALLGTLIMIKPMFLLDREGKIKVYTKVNGRKKAISLIWDNFIENVDPNESDFISVVHGDCDADTAPLAEKIKQLFPKAEILYDYLTPLVGSHTGPGAVGILYVSKKERD